MKKRLYHMMLVFSTLSILLFTSTELKAESDTFDGTVIDTVKWEISALGASSVTQDNALFVTSDGAEGEFSNTPGLFGPGAGVGSRYTLSGDFDIQVDFSGFSAPSIDYGQAFFNVYQDPLHQLHIKRIVGSSVNGIQSVFILGSTVRQGSGVTLFTGSSGRFRIVRVGSTIITFFDSGAGFVQHFSQSGLFTGDVVVALTAISPVGAISSVVFDNFLINSGRVICISPPVPQVTMDLAPDIFEVEVKADQEPEEPWEVFIQAFIEPPDGGSAIDIDVDTVTLSVNGTALAMAEYPLIVDNVLNVFFRLSLANVSAILRLDVAEVEGDMEKIEVNAITTPAQLIDLIELTVSGEVIGGESFSCTDAVRVISEE